MYMYVHVARYLLLVDPRCHHVRASNGLDLLDAVELLLGQELVKVSNDLVQQPHALDALVVAVHLLVIVGERWDGGKHHPGLSVVVRIELLMEERERDRETRRLAVAKCRRRSIGVHTEHAPSIKT